MLATYDLLAVQDHGLFADIRVGYGVGYEPGLVFGGAYAGGLGQLGAQIGVTRPSGFWSALEGGTTLHRLNPQGVSAALQVGGTLGRNKGREGSRLGVYARGTEALPSFDLRRVDRLDYGIELGFLL